MDSFREGAYRERNLPLVKKALSLLSSGMYVGLGSGRAASLFIEELGREIDREALRSIVGVASSEESRFLAKRWHIPLIEGMNFPPLDWVIDGADFVDSRGWMIKGGGGALFREKVLISQSRRVCILIQEEKRLSAIEEAPSLPLELSSFGMEGTLEQLCAMGHLPVLRKDERGVPRETAEGNQTVDLYFRNSLFSLETLHRQLLSLPALLETGAFFLPHATVFSSSRP